MRITIRRLLFLIASAAGLVAVTAGVAAAGTNLNHTEPSLDA